MTVTELQALLDLHDDGVLKAGPHPEGREFCALEFESKVRGREWSDRPVTLPDLRPLNDAAWSSDEARTQALLPVMAALWNWAEWSDARQDAWMTAVVLNTMQQIVAELPGLREKVRVQCREATTLKAVYDVARAIAVATYMTIDDPVIYPTTDAATNASYAARLLVYAAVRYVSYVAARHVTHARADLADASSYIARAASNAHAAAANTDDILIRACRIWIDAARA